MRDKRFEAVMTILAPQVIQLIVENYKTDEIAASKAFYESTRAAGRLRGVDGDGAVGRSETLGGGKDDGLLHLHRTYHIM